MDQVILPENVIKTQFNYSIPTSRLTAEIS